jgi:hypothetical protein
LRAFETVDLDAPVVFLLDLADGVCGMGRLSLSGARQRSNMVLVVVLCVLGAAVLLAAATMATWFALDSTLVGSLDQVYAATSAMIAVLALCGVVVSLTLQWRQVQVSQVVAARERHFELVMLAFEDPKLVFEQSPSLLSDDDRRLWMHSNLWMTQWKLLWQLGQIDEPELRRLALTLFADSPRLTWWQAAGPSWSVDRSRRGREFFRIVAEAHRDMRAAAEGTPPATRDLQLKVPRQRA